MHWQQTMNGWKWAARFSKTYLPRFVLHCTCTTWRLVYISRLWGTWENLCSRDFDAHSKTRWLPKPDFTQDTARNDWHTHLHPVQLHVRTCIPSVSWDESLSGTKWNSCTPAQPCGTMVPRHLHCQVTEDSTSLNTCTARQEQKVPRPCTLAPHPFSMKAQ